MANNDWNRSDYYYPWYERRHWYDGEWRHWYHNSARYGKSWCFTSSPFILWSMSRNLQDRPGTLGNFAEALNSMGEITDRNLAEAGVAGGGGGVARCNVPRE